MNAKYKEIVMIVSTCYVEVGACFGMTKNKIFENLRIRIAKVSYTCECKSYLFSLFSVVIVNGYDMKCFPLGVV